MPCGAMRAYQRSKDTAGYHLSTSSTQGLASSGNASACWPAFVTGRIGHRGIEGHDYSVGHLAVHGLPRATDALHPVARQGMNSSRPAEVHRVTVVASPGVDEGRGVSSLVLVATSTLNPPPLSVVAGCRLMLIKLLVTTGAGSAGPLATPTAAPLLSHFAHALQTVGSAARTHQAAAATAWTTGTRTTALEPPWAVNLAPRADGLGNQATSELAFLRAAPEFEGGVSRLGRGLRESQSVTESS